MAFSTLTFLCAHHHHPSLGLLHFAKLMDRNFKEPGPEVVHIISSQGWYVVSSVQFNAVAQSCLTPCDSMDCSMPDFPVHHQLPELAQTHDHQVSDAIQPSHPLSPLLLLPSVFPSMRVFSNESILHIRWPKYWSFSFSISPSNEYSGLISFRMDWLHLLAVQGTLTSLLQHHSSKASSFSALSFLYSPTCTFIHDYGIKP